MNYLFPNFLNDIQQYNQSRAFWKDLCDRVLANYQQSNLWVSWLESGNDLTYVGDGNPIYSIVNSTQLKGARIIQQDPSIHTKWQMAAWSNIAGDENSDPGIVRELVFTCNLTLKSAKTFEELFERWIQPECNVETIEELIGNLGFNKLP